MSKACCCLEVLDLEEKVDSRPQGQYQVYRLEMAVGEVSCHLPENICGSGVNTNVNITADSITVYKTHTTSSVKRTWKKQVKEERMKIGLREEDVHCRSSRIIGMKQITTRLD